jgi:hypothetical protein
MNEYKWISVHDVLPCPGLYLILNNELPLVAEFTGEEWKEHQLLTPLYHLDENITHWCEIPKFREDHELCDKCHAEIALYKFMGGKFCINCYNLLWTEIKEDFIERI